MKWAESESGCKEHPNNKQATGVCSYCLRDKLTQLYADSTIKASPCYPHSSSFSSSSSLSDSPHKYSSSAAYVHRRRHLRNASDHALHSISAAPSMFISVNNNNNGVMKKSRSTAFASRSCGVRDRGIVNASNRGRKKDGFWSKLLKLTKKGTTQNSVSLNSGIKSQGRG